MRWIGMWNGWAIGLMLTTAVFGAAKQGWAQDRRQDDERETPAAGVVDNIEDVTVPESYLGDEDFRPVGESMQLSLEQAINIASQYNPGIQVSTRGVEGSLYDLEVTNSAFRYNLDLSASAQENLVQRSGGSFRFDPQLGTILDSGRVSENDELVTGGPQITKTFRNGVTIDIDPSIDFVRDTERGFDTSPGRPDGNREDTRSRINSTINIPINSRPRVQIDTTIRNSELDAVRADYNLFIQEQTVTQQVINSYWNIQQIIEALDITRERLLQAKQIEFVLRVQYENEKEALVNVQQAEVDVLNQEATFIQQEGAYRNAVEQFNILLGTPIETKLQLTDPLEIQPLPISADEYVELVTSTNLEIKDQILAIEQLKNNLAVTRLGQQPDLSLTSSFFRDDEGAQTAFIGIMLTWAAIDGGATKARVRALEETIAQQEINLWNLERQLIQETYDDLRELQLQDKRIEILIRNVDQSRINLDNALIMFREFGRITFRDMQDFQIDLAQSRNTLVQAKVLYNSAMSNLLQKVHYYEPDDRIAPLLEVDEETLLTPLLDFLR